jgi:hypothetical protein
MSGNILDQIRDQVNSLSVDDVKAQLAKINADKAKQKERQKGKPHQYQKALTAEEYAALTDEQKAAYDEKRAKRTAYNKARLAKPEVKAKMKAYHQKPEVKARMKEYHQKRQASIKAILARAAELGLDPKTGEPAAAPAEQPTA